MAKQERFWNPNTRQWETRSVHTDDDTDVLVKEKVQDVSPLVKLSRDAAHATPTPVPEEEEDESKMSPLAAAAYRAKKKQKEAKK